MSAVFSPRYISVLWAATVICLLTACSGFPHEEYSATPSESNTPDAAASDEDYLRQYHEGLAEIHGMGDPPPVEVIRRVAPSEQSALVAECMRERGWSVVVAPEGGVMATAPDEQVLALNESWYVCWASYPPLDQYLRPLDDGQLERLYAYYLNELTPCLEAQGYAIDPPSQAGWMQDARTGNDYWMPYFDLDGHADEDVRRRCPEAPGDDVLFGDEEDSQE